MIYSLGQRTGSPGVGLSAWEIVAGANSPRILEMGFTSFTGGSSGSCIFGRSSSVGTGNPPVLFLDESDGNGPASLTSGAVLWTVRPGIPSYPHRRLFVATNSIATNGCAVIWTWPNGFTIPATTSVGLWAVDGTFNQQDVYAVIDE